MTDKEKIEILQRELRTLEQENTQLRKRPLPPPSSTARLEVEALIFEIRRLKTQVDRCEEELKRYQARIRELTDSFWARNPPGAR